MSDKVTPISECVLTLQVLLKSKFCPTDIPLDIAPTLVAALLHFQHLRMLVYRRHPYPFNAHAVPRAVVVQHR
jgi:hypothetical protein